MLPDWYWTLLAADRTRSDIRWLETPEGASWKWRALVAKAAETEAEILIERRRKSQQEHNEWRRKNGWGPLR